MQMQPSPLRGKGRGIAFIMAHKDHDGDACLIWPLSCDWHGYGHFGYLGKQHAAHRFMCELVNGPAPKDKPYALHSCGNGHNGCIHPKHLYWGTPTENQLESVAHGRGRKKDGRRRKLTAEQVAEIKTLLASVPQYQLAERFGVAPETISQIARGITWPDRPARFGGVVPPAERLLKVQRAKEMRAAGKSYYAIADEIGVSRLTAKNYANETETPWRCRAA